jgi:hypothetical protein
MKYRALVRIWQGEPKHSFDIVLYTPGELHETFTRWMGLDPGNLWPMPAAQMYPALVQHVMVVDRERSERAFDRWQGIAQ